MCSTSPTIFAESLSLSLSFRPLGGFFERLAGFEEAFQAGQNVRPTVRHRLDELRLRLVHFVNDGELHGIANLLEFVSDPRIAFRSQLGHELITPLENELARGIRFNDLSAVCNAATRNHDLPAGAGLPRALLCGLAPVLASEFRIGEGLPELFRRCANVRDINELRFSHRFPLRGSL